MRPKITCMLNHTCTAAFVEHGVMAHDHDG